MSLEHDDIVAALCDDRFYHKGTDINLDAVAAQVLKWIREETAVATQPFAADVTYDLDVDALSVGDRIELNGKSGQVILIDKNAPDPVAEGRPVVLVNWDE